MPVLTLTDSTLQAIYNIGRFRQPAEAVGLVVRGQIIQLPNRSLNSDRAFVVNASDIPIALEVAKIEMTAEDWDNLIFWHTHPGGLVGPSQVDMKNKHPNLTHLVVTLGEQGPIATFY